MIRPRVTITQTSIDAMAARLYGNAAHEARIMAEADGAAMLAIANDIIDAELPRRDGDRHKTNTTHLDSALTYVVEQPRANAFPITVALTIKPGVSAAKVAALEFGVQGEHQITAGTRTPGAKHLRWGTAPGDLRKPYQKTVTWKPTGRIAEGYHFMQRARDMVAARRRRSS